jgi:tetratricopeptide (TPR) repeat protein
MQSSPRIDELRQKFHENPRRYFAPLANEYRKAGDPEQAIAICRAHLAQQPGHMSGHVVYGQSLYDAGRMDEAAVVFHQALALDPENIIVLRHLGDIARQRGDVDEARSWYSRALDGDPHDAEVAAYLAELTEPLTAAPQAQPVAQAQPQPEGEAESQPEAQTGLQGETDVTPAEAVDAVPETAAERADIEETALEGAESEGLAAVAPTAAPEFQPTPQGEPEGDFTEWPESAIEPEAPFNVFDADETRRPDELISPYAREMELAAPSEMKWDLNDSPYLELSESTMSDDARDSVWTEPRETPAANAGSAVHEEQPPTSMQASGEAPPDGQPSDATDGADQEQTPPIPLTEPPAEPSSRKTPSRSTPVGESAPIVTRTLAELYLQQGYIEPALEIYRQLAEQEPDDRGLQARIEEISTDVESIAAREDEDAAREMATAGDSEDEPAEPPVSSESKPDVEADTTIEPEPTLEPEPTFTSAPADELWDSADSWGDRPFTDAEDRDEIFGLPDDVAAPAQEVADPEPFVAPRVITVREFFATLGSARPPVRDVEHPAAPAESTVAATTPEPPEASSEPVEYPIADDAFGNLFAGVPANPEDSRAAAVLSGAVAHGAVFATPLSTPTSPAPQVPQQDRESGTPAEESEEDVRRFREWLDGLADS